MFYSSQAGSGRAALVSTSSVQGSGAGLNQVLQLSLPGNRRLNCSALPENLAIVRLGSRCLHAIAG